ncbi:MAG: flavin monoamine oxidase family protein [Gemmatimonadetes bacterium]|nr:flavin monoamine oxidase family protein [Gemmatimonadota bacterium]
MKHHNSLMTRRDVLQAFGFVGGSSLVMGTMDTWGLMGASAGTSPALQGRQPGTRVIVLGAGISGLTVGYELGKLDYDYRILEARDFVGGLCWTVRRGSEHTEVGGERQVCQFDEGQYLNAGAWRIPNADKAVLGYCKEFGVPLEMFVNWSDANYMWQEDSERGPLAGRRVRLREVKADLWGSTAELLAKAMDQGQIDAPLTEEDKGLLLEFLVSAGYLDSEDHLYRPPNLRGSEDRYDLSALLRSGFGTRVRSLNSGTGGPHPVFQPVGGMMEIPLAFQRAIGDHITMNAEVQSIHQTEDSVRVVYKDTRTGQEREETADYCVCCLPMAVLQGIDVDLSPEMAAAVNEASHSTSAKMGLQMKRRFWEEDDEIFGGHIFGRSLELGEFSYPSNDYFTEKGVLLGFYGSGGTAGMADMPFAGRIEHVLTQASKVHPQMREEFETAYCVWWDKVPYSLGAYGRTPAPEQLEQLSKADGRIYMGSAGASTRPAWIEGAIQSAWRTIEALHERVAGS